MDLIKYLQAQGLGTRRECRHYVTQNRVRINGMEPFDDVHPDDVQALMLDDEAMTVIPLPFFYILLNKPVGYETSHRPKHYPSVFSWLPAQFQQISLQAVGRLDADTSGVLLITNDGVLNHQLTSARYKVPKIYRATLKHAADESLCTKLMKGVLLNDEAEFLQADCAHLIDELTLEMTLHQGKYHQVKRMIAAAGNRVEALHRTYFSGLSADDLPFGQWRYIHKDDLF